MGLELCGARYLAVFEIMAVEEERFCCGVREQRKGRWVDTVNDWRALLAEAGQLLTVIRRKGIPARRDIS